MSELKDYKVYTTRHEGAWGYHYEPNPNNQSDIELNGEQVYLKKDADKVIAEKDQEIAELKKKLMPCLNGDCILTCEVVEKYGKENAELKAKLEDAKASHYAEMVDAGMRERRLRRAFYKACANWAHIAVFFFSSYATKEKWYRMEHKCLNKAKEYK
jgi:hypothetical protein